MKVLNLYVGIGGNRKLWKDCEVTAVEINPKIAALYQAQFPQDKVVVGDAHAYLLEHFEEFDFIWSSPPCPTHGQLRFRTRVLGGTSKPVYPDMKLYEEIILLMKHFKGKWVVENVESYYEPLIRPVRVARHFFWGNFQIYPCSQKDLNPARASVTDMRNEYGLQGGRVELRNCVHPVVGLHILRCAFKLKQEVLI
jgi:DNA (cytosine-5)-methyltransferase 1